MPSKNEVKKKFQALEKWQQRIVIYRVLLQRFSHTLEKDFSKKEEYLKVMFFLLSVESLFFRRKKIAFARALARDLDLAHDLARALDLALALALDLARAHDLARALALDLDRALALARDLDLARALARDRDLFLEEIKYISSKGREESEANLLYVEGLQVEGMDSNPFIKFLYDSSVDEGFVDKFYETIDSVDKKRFESSSLKELIRYFQTALNVGLEKRNVARVIVLGNGNAGKTSLIKKLANIETNTSKQDLTPRIEISHDVVDGAEVDYWDFGGQVFMHATHTFFMTSAATYVIVCNARADEQPDRWLEILRQRLGSSSHVAVLVVYTHIDSDEERENFGKLREHALQRAYKGVFDLSFHLHSSEKVDTDAYNTLKSTLQKHIYHQAKTQTYKEVVELYKDAKTKFIEAEEIYEQCKDFTKDGDGTSLVKELMLSGYIFPQKPMEIKSYKYNKEDRFVWQKHWLTYGVYEIINHKLTKKQKGIVSKADFKKMLFEGKPRYILQNGHLQKSKPKRKSSEKIVYDDEDIDVLYNIVQNYQWAIVNSKNREVLIFPHAVSLDEPEFVVLEPYLRRDEQSIVLTVLLDYVPVDFFFRFVTLADTHIHDTALLWRDGGSTL